MKKVLGLTLIAVMALSILVSCSAEVRNDGMAHITLSNGNSSKGIVAQESTEDGDIKDLSDYNWTYTAQAGNGQLGYGETNGEQEMEDGTASLNISYGTWTFTLYGYDDDDNLVYMGREANVQINTRSSSVVVNVDKLTTSPDDHPLAPAIIRFSPEDGEDNPFQIVSGNDVIAPADPSKTEYYLYKVLELNVETDETDDDVKAYNTTSEAVGDARFNISDELVLEPGMYKFVIEFEDKSGNKARAYEYVTFKAGQVYDLCGTLELSTISDVTVVRGGVIQEVNVLEGEYGFAAKISGPDLTEGLINYIDDIEEFDDETYLVNVLTGNGTTKIMITDGADMDIELMDSNAGSLVVELLGEFNGTITANDTNYEFIQHVDDDKSYSFSVWHNVSTGQSNILGNLNYCDDGIDTIAIPNGIEVISGNSICGTKGRTHEEMTFTKIVIPDSVVEINDLAISCCKNLTEIIISASVEVIEEGFIYRDCPSLERIIVDADNPYFTSTEDGILFDKNLEVLMYWPSSKAYDPSLMPNSVVSVAACAFINNVSTEIALPDSIETIGFAAFESSNIESFDFPDGFDMAEIASECFADCQNLESITIPECVSSIGSAAFSGCTSLEDINIPENVQTIGSFAFEGCTSITSFVVPDGVTLIDFSTFEGCSALTEVTIPYSVQKIENNAFVSCSNLAIVRYEGDEDEWEEINSGSTAFIGEYTLIANCNDED